MNLEVPGKKPEDTVRDYSFKGFNVKVNFLKGSPIYFSRNNTKIDTIIEEMEQDIDQVDTKYAQNKQFLTCLRNGLILVMGGATTAFVAFGYPIFDLPVLMSLSGTLAGSLAVSSLIVNNKLENVEKYHLYKENRNKFNNATIISNVREIEKVPKAKQVDANNIDRYSLKQLKDLKDKIEKAIRYEGIINQQSKQDSAKQKKLT